MSDNKPKVPATGMLEISINGGENLQGHLVGQLVFDKDNPFAAEILQATSTPAVIKSKITRQESVKNELDQEPENETEDGEIIDFYSGYSSPRTSVLTTKTNKCNEQETCDFINMKKDLKSSPLQALNYPSGKVHCNSCPECLRGGCDNREEYFPTVTTSGPESACIWQNLNRNINPYAKKERMAAGGTLPEENSSSGFHESYSSSCTPTQPEYKEKNNFSQYTQDYPTYKDSTHNMVFNEDPRVSQRPVTPTGENYPPNSQRHVAGGGGGMACCARQYCCNSGRVDLGDHSSNMCSLVKDLNCRTHNVRAALCCSVAENVHYARDNAYQQLCIIDNCEQHNVNQMERLLLEQRTTVPCCGKPVTDEVFSQNLRQQCIDQTPSGCGEVRESDDVSFRRRSLPLDCVPCITDCSPCKILRFASGRDDMAGEEMYSQHTKHHSLGRCCTGECYERRECEERDLMRRSGCPDGLPCPIKCIQPCDCCPPPAGNPALESQQPTEYSANWDCRFNSEEIFGHHKQLYNVDQGYCNYNEVNDDQKEYKRTSRPCDYVCLQQSLSHLQALDQCAGRTCGGKDPGGKDTGDAECFQHSKTRSMSRSPCGNRQLNESETRHDRRLYDAPVNNLGRPESPSLNRIPAGKNPTPTGGNLEYSHHSKARSVNSSPGGQIDLTESEWCKEQIQQVPSCKLAAGQDRRPPSRGPCGISDECNQFVHTRIIDRSPEGTIDLLEHEQKEFSQNIPASCYPCPVSIPGPFGGPGPIPCDTDILDLNEIDYPNSGRRNAEFVTTPRLPAAGYQLSTVSDKKVVAPSAKQGDEDYIQHSVMRTVDKDEGGAVVIVEKEQKDLVQFVTPGYDERQLQQQISKNRLGAAGSARSPNPRAKTPNSCEMVNENHFFKDDLIKSRIVEPEKEYNQHSNRNIADKNNRGNLDFQQKNDIENISSECKSPQKIGPYQRQTAGANSVQLTREDIPTEEELQCGLGRGDADSSSQLSDEGVIFSEEPEEMHAEEYMQHSRTRTVDKLSTGALDVIEQENKDSVQVIPPDYMPIISNGELPLQSPNMANTSFNYSRQTAGQTNAPYSANNVENVPECENVSNIPLENDQPLKAKCTEDNYQTLTSQSCVESSGSVSPDCNQGNFPKTYFQQSFPNKSQSSKQQPYSTLQPINSMQSNTLSSTFSPIDPQERTLARLPEVNGSYYGDSAHFQYNSPAFAYPNCSQAGWNRTYPSAMTAIGDLRFRDKYLPNSNSYEPVQDKHRINDFNSRSYVPSCYYGMQQEYFPNYCRMNMAEQIPSLADKQDPRLGYDYQKYAHYV